MKLLENDLYTVINYIKIELQNILPHNEINTSINILLMHYLGLTKVDIALNRDKIITDNEKKIIINALAELKKNKPLAYILGEWEFYGLRILVDENTLIPRQETEELVQLIIKENKCKTNLSILDIGTGSGCIALALKANVPTSTILAWDIAEKTLNIAKKNANELHLPIQFERKNILEEVVTVYNFDVIVSNPPYVTENEKALMSSNVLNYEPAVALFVENNQPLLFYEAIANFGLMNLNMNGKLYFEINEHFGKEVQKMLREKGYQNVNVVKDLNGKDRVVRAEK